MPVRDRFVDFIAEQCQVAAADKLAYLCQFAFGEDGANRIPWCIEKQDPARRCVRRFEGLH